MYQTVNLHRLQKLNFGYIVWYSCLYSLYPVNNAWRSQTIVCVLFTIAAHKISCVMTVALLSMGIWTNRSIESTQIPYFAYLRKWKERKVRAPQKENHVLYINQKWMNWQWRKASAFDDRKCRARSRIRLHRSTILSRFGSANCSLNHSRSNISSARSGLEMSIRHRGFPQCLVSWPNDPALMILAVHLIISNHHRNGPLGARVQVASRTAHCR